jgi:hypothetical protein
MSIQSPTTSTPTRWTLHSRPVYASSSRLTCSVCLLTTPSLQRLPEPRAIPLLSDAACSPGAELDGESPARFGVAATFSFNPRKIVTTREGRMVASNDDTLALRIMRLRNHGFERPDFLEQGFNYRLSDIRAAVGSAQVPQLTEIVRRRDELAQQLRARLEALDLTQIPVIPRSVGRVSRPTSLCSTRRSMASGSSPLRPDRTSSRRSAGTRFTTSRASAPAARMSPAQSWFRGCSRSLGWRSRFTPASATMTTA